MFRRSSTTDIIADKISSRSLEKVCQTGDLLLVATSCKERELWFRIITAVQGYRNLQRRLPILHCVVLVKDPPKDVLMAYGLTEKDSRVYCLESTCHSPDGCRLIPLEEWLKRELNPLFVGSKVLYRSCEVTDDTWVAPKAFWNWVIEARTIPYTKLSTKAGFDLLYNWLFSSERVVQALLEVQTDLSMVRVMKIVGDGPLGHIFAGFCGLVAQFALALYFTIVTITVILFHIPELLHQGRLGRVPAETNERGFVKTTNCSGCTAESLMNLGLLDGTKTDSSWWLPRDFLPRDVASSATGGNLLDLHTTQAKYANTLIDVFVPDYELEQRTRQSVRYSFQKQLARELRQYTGTEEFSYDSDSDSAESD